MFSKHVRSWLLASAITVLFAVVLLTVAFPTPAEAGGPGWCCSEPVGTCLLVCATCSEVRAACRQDPKLAGYVKRGSHPWKQICGPENPICPSTGP